MATENEIEVKVKQLRNLKVNKKKSEEEIRDQAIRSLDKKNDPQKSELGRDINIGAKFKSQLEKRMAVELLERYLEDYEITSISDKNTLQEVIYLEVLQLRLQEKLNELHSGDLKALPYDIISIVHKNSEVIIKLKSTLGLNKAKAEKLEAFTELDLLRKRFEKWREENQASRTIKCPHCTKFVFLKMRCKHWEEQKHPFFQDNMIFNKHLFAHYGKQVLIDNVFIAGVLETSKDYIEWVLARVRNPQAMVIKIGKEVENEQATQTPGVSTELPDQSQAQETKEGTSTV